MALPGGDSEVKQRAGQLVDSRLATHLNVSTGGQTEGDVPGDEKMRRQNSRSKFQSHVRISMPFQGCFPSPLASSLPCLPFPTSYVILLRIELMQPICF